MIWYWIKSLGIGKWVPRYRRNCHLPHTIRLIVFTKFNIGSKAVPIKSCGMITSYYAFATILRVIFTPPAVWAPVSGIRESENVVRDSGVLIGVFVSVYHCISSLLSSDYHYYFTVGCRTPLVISRWEDAVLEHSTTRSSA